MDSPRYFSFYPGSHSARVSQTSEHSRIDCKLQRGINTAINDNEVNADLARMC